MVRTIARSDKNAISSDYDPKNCYLTASRSRSNWRKPTTAVTKSRPNISNTKLGLRLPITVLLLRRGSRRRTGNSSDRGRHVSPGLSLESLRDLEQVPLTAASEEGGYFHEHLKKLFRSSMKASTHTRMMTVRSSSNIRPSWSVRSQCAPDRHAVRPRQYAAFESGAFVESLPGNESFVCSRSALTIGRERSVA